MNYTLYEMSEKRWEAILELRELFLNSELPPGHDFPHIRNYIDPEVVDSWQRSRDAGLTPTAKNITVKEQLDISNLENILNSNKLIINNTLACFEGIKKMALLYNYHLFLDEHNGYALVRLADGELYMPIQNLIIDLKKGGIDSAWGRISQEHIIGTNAHIMTRHFKRPVRLYGPEHYLEAFEDKVASSAPIFDANGQVIATLTITQPLEHPPWNPIFTKDLQHCMALVTTMAKMIEISLFTEMRSSQLSTASKGQLLTSKSKLSTAYSILNTAIDITEEGIIIVDLEGNILKANNTGKKILSTEQDVENRNIREFLDDPSHFTASLLKQGSSVIEDVIFNKSKEPYMVNIRPVANDKTDELDMFILKLYHTSKVNSLSNDSNPNTASYDFDQIIGESREIKSVIELGKRFANTMENILLTGESGTGKELFAQAIHNASSPVGPFIALNCAAIPVNLIESELFGYEGGSFTGAKGSGRVGKIELANEGTLFLDEIGDMPLELQSTLLRVLEDKRIMRIGGNIYKKINFRVIAATNKDLEKMVEEKLFREDLYYRLSVLSIILPPLRNRTNDIELLIHHFITKYCAKMGWKIPEISPSALKRVKEFPWPGNVRQLENAVIYAANMAQNEIIEYEHLPNSLLHFKLAPDLKSANKEQMEEIKPAKPAAENALSLKNFEKSAIENALFYSQNNIPLAAKLLEISKSTLYRKLREYDIGF